MGDHDATPTCLSAEPHGPEVIRDFLAHYFGCIEIYERTNFLSRSRNKHFWDKEVQLEIQKLEQQDGTNDTDLETLCARAEANIEKKISSLALSIEAQYKRTDTLRHALEGVECAHRKPDESENLVGEHSEVCDLVECLAESHKDWKLNRNTIAGMEQIRRWKKVKGKPVDPQTPDRRPMDPGRYAVREVIKNANPEHTFDDKVTKYDLERDINGYIIQWEIVKPQQTRPGGDASRQPSMLGSRTTARPNLPSKSSTLSISTITAEETTKDVLPQQEGSDTPRSRRPSMGHQMKSFSSHLSKSFFKIFSNDEKYLKGVSEKSSDYRFKGQFPDQRLSLRFLLGEDPNDLDRDSPTELDDDVVLNKDRNKDRVRYIHIPHNNMAWIEQAVARYFGDHNPNHGCIYREPPIKTRSHMVLRPEYWRGQQHGGRRSMVHSRHMRAICERVSSQIWDSEDNPGNLVLFMPYLHWEEDRKREKIATIIEEETAKDRKRRDSKAKEAKTKRIKDRTFNGSSLTMDRKRIEHQAEDYTHQKKILATWDKNSFGDTISRPQRTVTELAEGLARTGPVEYDEHDRDGQKLWYVAKLKSSRHGRVEAKSRLGQFLLDAARLYEAMAIYRDQQLLEKYLHHDPPLHPRRTLDQSYYWTLKTTKARDRDQVVYRGTTMDDRNVHRFRQAGKKGCPGEDNCTQEQSPLKRFVSIKSPENASKCPHEPVHKLEEFRWDGHMEKTDKDGCDHCRAEIRKISRVVMVDQLWMWILDRNTIITSFPKRYGANKQDPSGVHKSIRTRIKRARKNEIRSVFDVALIILDECSNTFFDRTKTPDRHPQVMDIFGEAIGNLTNLQTVSFQHLWHWTKRASQVYISKSKYEDASHLHFPLLNINPEGKLQREIKDIIDELDIMININSKQKEVIKRFTKHVENIYDWTGQWRDESRNPKEDRDYRNIASRSSSPVGVEGPGIENEAQKELRKREKEEFDWFRKRAYDLISDVSDRVLELEGLRKSAESTSQGIKDLLDLKQQQASILQAWQSVKQADESVRQGRSIMIFTIVTIIFLPLSFMSSVFGMNNSTIGSDKMSFGEQANFMFPISAAVISVSIIFAFWTFPRTIFWSAYKMLETWILVHSGAYRVWLVVREKYKYLRSDDLLKNLEKEVNRLKGEVKEKRRRKQKNATQGNADAKESKTQGKNPQNAPNSATSTQSESLQDQGSDISNTEVGSRGSSGNWRLFPRRPKVQDSGEVNAV